MVTSGALIAEAEIRKAEARTAKTKVKALFTP
jgi:hypothetical protein